MRLPWKCFRAMAIVFVHCDFMCSVETSSEPTERVVVFVWVAIFAK